MARTQRSAAASTISANQLLSGGAIDNCGPTKIAAFLDALHSRLKTHFDNCVKMGLLSAAPTNASTQATGATGATVARVNLAAGVVIVNGTQKSFAAEADRVLHDTTVYTGADAGAGTTTLTTTNCYAKITIVATSNSATRGSGTVSLVNCKGATATTSALALECTDAEIQTKATGVLPWVKVAVVELYRSADTVISQTNDSTAAPAIGVNSDSDFFVLDP